MARPKLPPLIGTYAAPPVQVGDRLYCEYHKAELEIVGFTAAPIRWPLCPNPRSARFTALPLCGDLVRAARTEKAADVAVWWGVSPTWLTFWRRALGVGLRETEGTRRAHAAADRVHRDRRPPPEVRAKIRAAAARYAFPWTPELLALMGTMTDREVASRAGVSYHTARRKRIALGIPLFTGRGGGHTSRREV